VNKATVSGTGASSGTSVSANDSATATVKPISVTCDIQLFAADDMDNNANDSNLLLPPTDAPSTISGGFILKITNTGQATVSINSVETASGDVSLSGCVDSGGTPVDLNALSLTLDPGQSATFTCDIVLGANACPGPDTIQVTVTGTAVATTAAPCIFDSTGAAATTAPHTCSGTITCQTPVSCRTTGGGTMFNCDQNQDCALVTTVLSPAFSASGTPLDHVSHGGQLGAPYSQQDCATILADPCIRGQWQHTRHYVGHGNPRDNYAADFHSNTPKGIFDTLLCACLGCCGTTDKNANGHIATSHKFVVCNPSDHKVCGPMPSPAPANALIFSGIGTVQPATDVGPSKTANWVVFRVYVEDRSEPGGSHPKGGVSPADIYVFQAWDTGIPVTKKADPNALGNSPTLGDVNTFRSNLSLDSCAFLQGISVGGTCPPGSLPSPIVAGLTASVNDEGALRTGNQQIHPSTGATCTAPGGIPAPAPTAAPAGCVNPPTCGPQ
jgi:hypothetical protein